MTTITKYQVRGYSAFSELDKWDSGCDGETLQEHMPRGDWQIKADSFDELLDMLTVEFKSSDFLLNSCDELGRIDLQAYQLQAFQTNRPSIDTEKKWKLGKADLWLTCYTFYLEIVTTNLDLTTLTERRF